jgi:FMN phosphatase YigB (HAD superfamily)
MSFKILSDFDGVWTDQAIEAEGVKLFLVAEAARLAGIRSNQALAHFAVFEAHTRAAPAEFGWAPDGRITAYVDEDPFCVANSIAAYLEVADGELPARYRAAIRDGGHQSLTHFADHCFLTATANFRTLHPPALVPEARTVLAELQAAGAEVVVVSNSAPEKLITWFRQLGIDAGESRDHALRVRGSAGKFVLGESDAALEVGGRRIYVDRPKYRAILAEERPDLVIGDVYSLDLALPQVLRQGRQPGAPKTLVLRRHEHTPSWVLRAAEAGLDRVVDGVGELLDLIPAVR